MSALAGKRVVITRARHQADRFVAALAARGAHPILCPAIAIQAVDDADIDQRLGSLGAFAWIVFTSSNAVVALLRWLHARDIRQLPPSMMVASIGPGTTRTLEAFGIAVKAEPATHTGAAIAPTMGDLRGVRVLLPQGDIARADTALTLRNHGAHVTEVIVYRTVMGAPDSEALAQVRAGADAITFTSPSTVRGFSAMAGAEARVLMKDAVLATIGGATSAQVQKEGWGVPLEARRATEDSLMDALENYWGTGHVIPEPSR